MLPMALKNKTGILNLKSLLIPIATIGGLIAGLFLNQVAKENNILLWQTPKPVLAKSQNDPAKENAPKLSQLAAEEKDLSPTPVKILSGKDCARKTTGTATGLTDRLSNPENSLLRLKDYIKNIEEKNAFLKEKVELLTKLADSKEKEIMKLKSDNAGLEENLNKTLESQAKLKNGFEVNLNNLNTQLNQKTTEVANLTAIRAYLENQINELNNKLSILSGTSSDLQSQLTKAQQDKSSQETDLSKIKDDLSRQMAINETLNKNIDGIKEEVATKEKERLSLANELQQIGEAKKNLEAQLNELKIIKTDNENQISQLNSRISELNSLTNETKNLNAQLKSMLADKDTEIRNKQNQISKILGDSEAQLRDKQDEITKIIADKDAQLRDKQDEISKIKRDFEKFAGEKQALFLSMQEKEKSNIEIGTKLNDLDSQLALVQNALALEKGRYGLALEQIKKLVAVNNALKAKLKDIYTELELIREEKKINSFKRGAPKRNQEIQSGLDELENQAR
jgi:chromosome segregation ATPase